MISFCVLEEFLGLLSNSYGRTVSDGIPSIHDSKNLEDYKSTIFPVPQLIVRIEKKAFRQCFYYIVEGLIYQGVYPC